MLLDNTQRTGMPAIKTPVSQLVRRGYAAPGLMGMGDIFQSAVDPNASADPNSIIAALNAELVYLNNLYRANQGLPPLPASASPTVNVGLSTGTLVLLGLGLFLLLKK